jgi:NTP pyrophosphatase (non-canonical NTP hydrolase)
MLNQLSSELHASAQDKGFYDDFNALLDVVAVAPGADLRMHIVQYEANTKLLLIATEIAEVVEEMRKGNAIVSEAVEEEFADILIRLLDLAGFLGIDLDSAVKMKREKNNARPHKHGKSF